MISVLLLFLLALYLFYRHLQQQYQVFARDGVPGPKPTFLIGNLGEFANKDPLDTYAELTRKFGKAFGFYEGLTPSIVVSDPVLIEQILVKYFHQFDGRPRITPFLHGAEYHTVQNLHGHLWKRSREAVASAFKTGNIRMMWPRLQTASNRYINSLGRQLKEYPHGFNIIGENEAYILESFFTSAFDVDYDSLAAEDRNSLLLYMRAAHKSASPETLTSGLSRIYPALAPFLKMFDTDHRRQAMRHFRSMSRLLRREKTKLQDGKRTTNLLQHLLAARVRSKDHANNTVYTPLSETELLGMVSSLFGGGLGPVSATLDFVVHCLAVHPDKQDKLREEVLAVCGEQEPLTMDQVQAMEYLDMFINETFRHYTVAPGVARTCSEDCVIRGVQFREGTVIRLMGSVQYRDPSVYPNPSQFCPERFSKAEREKRHPYSFIPFGSGPRMCVARRLGLLQVKLTVVQLLRHFRVCKCPSTQTPLPVALRPFLCPKDGVFVRLEPRNV